jgi:uncharacterized protein with GYD domain
MLALGRQGFAAPARRRQEALADAGGEMKQFYLVLGDCDFDGICEAPDDAVMARYQPVGQAARFVIRRTV